MTDWCLEQFRSKYGPDLTKDDIWNYIYGVMHAPDWRNRYRHDLQRNLPRIPLAADFKAFCVAGGELMDLHTGYETCEEAGIDCAVDKRTVIDGKPVYTGLFKDETELPPEAFRIEKRMRLERDSGADTWTLKVNDRCSLMSIPQRAFDYKISGRSPLEWAVDSLRLKEDRNSGIVDDPNCWHVWADDPFELIRHLRRCAFIGIRSAEIIDSLPPSLGDDVNDTPEVGEKQR
ncbi:MAG: hypothetical protein OXK19_05355 [Candidatus Dadabacteria bacterium]|nr:hypothetical protein [Candidatus Dadabacteria bacterium]